MANYDELLNLLNSGEAPEGAGASDLNALVTEGESQLEESPERAPASDLDTLVTEGEAQMGGAPEGEPASGFEGLVTQAKPTAKKSIWLDPEAKRELVGLLNTEDEQFNPKANFKTVHLLNTDTKQTETASVLLVKDGVKLTDPNTLTPKQFAAKLQNNPSLKKISPDEYQKLGASSGDYPVDDFIRGIGKGLITKTGQKFLGKVSEDNKAAYERDRILRKYNAEGSGKWGELFGQMARDILIFRGLVGKGPVSLTKGAAVGTGVGTATGTLDSIGEKLQDGDLRAEDLPSIFAREFGISAVAEGVGVGLTKVPGAAGFAFKAVGKYGRRVPGPEVGKKVTQKSIHDKITFLNQALGTNIPRDRGQFVKFLYGDSPKFKGKDAETNINKAFHDFMENKTGETLTAPKIFKLAELEHIAKESQELSKAEGISIDEARRIIMSKGDIRPTRANYNQALRTKAQELGESIGKGAQTIDNIIKNKVLDDKVFEGLGRPKIKRQIGDSKILYEDYASRFFALAKRRLQHLEDLQKYPEASPRGSVGAAARDELLMFMELDSIEALKLKKELGLKNPELVKGIGREFDIIEKIKSFEKYKSMLDAGKEIDTRKYREMVKLRNDAFKLIREQLEEIGDKQTLKQFDDAVEQLRVDNKNYSIVSRLSPDSVAAGNLQGIKGITGISSTQVLFILSPVVGQAGLVTLAAGATGARIAGGALLPEAREVKQSWGGWAGGLALDGLDRLNTAGDKLNGWAVKNSKELTPYREFTTGTTRGIGVLLKEEERRLENEGQ